ncbi:MAG: serine/threonine-protein kinase [Planctomycetota bacterium]
MSSTSGPPPANQPENPSSPPGAAGGAAAKSGPPSEDLDHFPTLEDNPAAPVDPVGANDAMPTRLEIERTVPFGDTAASDSVQDNTSVAPGTGATGGSSAHPPISGADDEATTRDSVPTRAMAQHVSEARDGAKPPSPHVRALIDAGLFAPASTLAATRGAFAVVEGRYELRDTLGEGGMGLVFLAYDNVGDCLVALKTLKPNFLNSAKSRARFIDEAKEMNRIPAHACVLVVKDFGSVDKPFYVTEYLSGGSVGHAIRANGPLPTDLARRYATNIASAIAYIHAKRGKLHRDIKPENVLIDDDGSARLADFGLVWQMGEGSRGMRAGTVPYMPPEVVADQRKNVGYEWDVYSFGATLYEMLAGHAPYADLLKREVESTGKTRLEVLRHLISQVPPTPILACNKSADKHLARIADWAMARDARDRYFHVDHILADLDRLGRGKKPMGPQQTAGCEKGGRVCLIRRVVAATLLVLAIGAGGIWYFAPGWLGGGGTPPPDADTQTADATGASTAIPLTSPPVTTGPMFEQSRVTSPLNFTFTTLGGVTRYRPAPPEQWALISGKSFDYEHEMPWKPAAHEALAFTARVDQPAHLVVLMRGPDGALVQLLPNTLETDTRLQPRQNRLIPRPIAPQTQSYWLQVTPPAGTETVKAIVADRPFTISGIGTQGFPAVPEDFRVVVDGKSYDSFAAAFGARWQTVDLTIEVVE